MEFKNRQSVNPGRIQLQSLEDNSVKTYKLILADGATEQGTVLNEATMNAFKEDILNAVLQLINASDTTSGIGIADVTFKERNNNGDNVYRLQLTNGATYDFVAPRGEKGDKGDKGDKGEKGDSGQTVTVSTNGFYTSTQSLSTGVGRYDVSSVTYDKPELQAGDLVLSVVTGNMVRIRSLSADGFTFIGEWVYSF